MVMFAGVVESDALVGCRVLGEAIGIREGFGRNLDCTAMAGHEIGAFDAGHGLVIGVRGVDDAGDNAIKNEGVADAAGEAGGKMGFEGFATGV